MKILLLYVIIEWFVNLKVSQKIQIGLIWAQALEVIMLHVHKTNTKFGLIGEGHSARMYLSADSIYMRIYLVIYYAWS